MFHYGHSSPGPNLKLFNVLVSRLAVRLQERWKAIAKSIIITHILALLGTFCTDKHSGCIINTCGWVDGSGYKSLIHVAQSFEGDLHSDTTLLLIPSMVVADVILVLDNERLFNDLKKGLPQETTKILRLPKSGGVSCRVGVKLHNNCTGTGCCS